MTKEEIQQNNWEVALLWAATGDVSTIEGETEDIIRVRDSLQRVRGREASFLEAAIFWTWRSDDYSASFLALPSSDEDLDKDVKEYVDKLMGEKVL